jgi:periplasmic protein TonB
MMEARHVLSLKPALAKSLALHLLPALAAVLFSLSTPLVPPVVMIDLVPIGAESVSPRSGARPAAVRPPPPPPPAEVSTAQPAAAPRPREQPQTDQLVSQRAAPALPASGIGREGESVSISLEDSYKARVSMELERRKTYPAVARRLGQTGRVVLKFKIGKSGEVLSAELVAPSAHSSLNQAAQGLLLAMRSFDPIPDELGRASWEFTVPVEYRLN